MKVHCNKIHLCDSCVYQYPQCNADNVEFGCGKGNDNIIECKYFNQGDKQFVVCSNDCVC